MVKFEGYEFVDGGVCAAEGFTAAGVIAGAALAQVKDDPCITVYHDAGDYLADDII